MPVTATRPTRRASPAPCRRCRLRHRRLPLRDVHERRQLDGVGIASAWPQATVKLDRTPPTALTVLGVPGGCAAGPVTLTATGSIDPVSGFDHYESTVNGGSVVQGANVQVSGHGTFTVKLRAVDAVGNATAWVTTTVCLS